MKDIKTWKEILKEYKYSDPQSLYDKVKTKGFTKTPEDIGIIREIVLWKINREIDISDETIAKINEIAGKNDSPEKALNDPMVKECFEKMLYSGGIRLPMASTILHFYQPKAFPIIEDRAYRQACRKKFNPAGGWEVYSEYITACIKICHENGISFEKIDKVLYQLDKDNGFKIGDVWKEV